jgi:hypothetical protein
MAGGLLIDRSRPRFGLAADSPEKIGRSAASDPLSDPRQRTDIAGDLKVEIGVFLY